MSSTPRSRFRHVAIVGKYDSPALGDTVLALAHHLASAGCEVAIERNTAEGLGLLLGQPKTAARPDFEVLSAAGIGAQCDAAVVVGGDGTMLGMARDLAAHEVPLIGVNQGRLGFITDIPVGAAAQALTLILNGEYEEEHRAVLQGSVERDGETIFEAIAVNDVVVSRGSATGMVELRIEVDGHFMANQRSDGLIVASPTGSTAYALSAGGPIVHPGIGGWVMAPIAPHTLTNRPIVVPQSSAISIEIRGGRDVSVNFDMQSLKSLVTGDRIHVRRYPKAVRFLHPKGWNFYATLRRKLHWNEGAV